MANGSQMTKNLMALVIALTVGGILIAQLLPVAIDQMFTTNTSAWSNETSTLWDLLPLFVIIAALLAVVGLAMDRF